MNNPIEIEKARVELGYLCDELTSSTRNLTIYFEHYIKKFTSISSDIQKLKTKLDTPVELM